MKHYLQQSPDQPIQEKFCSGWKTDHYVTNVFVFVPDGTIPIAFFNVSGCVHDCQVVKWGGIYDKLGFMFKSNGEIFIQDSAFGKIDWQISIKSSQDFLFVDEIKFSCS